MQTHHKFPDYWSAGMLLLKVFFTSGLSLSVFSTKRPSLLSVVQFNCTAKGLSSRSSLRSLSHTNRNYDEVKQ